MSSILANASRDELNAAIVENYYQSWSEILSHYKFASPVDLFGIEGFISGIPYMMMNSLFDGPPQMSKKDINEVLNYYRSNNIPMMWFISPRGVKYGIASVLRELEVEEATMQVPGMVNDLANVDQDGLHKHIDGFSIVNLDPTSQNHIDQYTTIFMSAFEIDEEIREEMTEFAKSFPSHPNSLHFLLTMDGKAVATGSVIYAAGVAGIYNIATLPNYQRRGLATAIMSKLLIESIDKGYQYSILHSSERGKQVYERLGYESYFVFNRFLLRPSDVGLE